MTSEQGLLLYIGTYTKPTAPGRPRSAGIYVYRFAPETGTLSHLHTVGDVPNPSYLAIDPTGRFVFAANEEAGIDGHGGGAVSAFARDPQSGDLTFLNREASHGDDPCYIAVTPHGRALTVANYSSGSAAILPIGEDGRLAPASYVDQHSGSSANPQRQQGPHAHAIPIDPSGQFALCPDLGIDRVVIYRLNEAGQTMTPHQPAGQLAPGTGPRHLTFHPTQPIAYVIGELASTITAFNWDAEAGTLTAFQTVSTLPNDFTGESTCADIHVTPSGRFIYGSNRGHDSLAGFAIDEASGRLSPTGHTPSGGKTPRNFAIDPTGSFVLAANQGSDNVTIFRLDPATGELTPTGEVATIPAPVALEFLPASAR